MPVDRLSTEYVSSKLVHFLLKSFVRPPRELYETPGYFNPIEGRLLYWLGRQVRPGGLAVEVGSFKGKSSNFFAAGLPEGARLACVDTWQNDAMPYDQREDVMGAFLENTRRFRNRIESHRGSSTDVAAGWKRPLDALFIDGDHSYEGCLADLRAWTPFVRPGGWIALHDSAAPGVRRAIAEFFSKGRRRFYAYAWSVYFTRQGAAA